MREKSLTILPLFVTAAFLFAGCKNSDPTTPRPDNGSTGLESKTMDDLSYIEPTAEAISVGLAGERPANIARYLLANGAQEARLSPDGATVAYSSGITGKTQIWTIPVGGGQSQQLTFGNGVTFFEWLPQTNQKDAQLIYGADNNGNEQESYFLIHADGSAEREILAASENGFRVFGGFNQDGTQISYASTERNGLDFDIYTKKLNSEGDSTPKRVFDGVYGNFVEAISPDGQTLILSDTVGEDSDNLYALNLNTGERRTLSNPTPRANHTDANILFVPGENSLLFATNKGREFAALTHMSLDTGTETVLFETDVDVENISLCGPMGKNIAFTTNNDGFSHLHIMRDNEVETVKSLPEGVYDLSCNANSDTLLIKISGFDRPGDLYTYNTASKTTERIFTSNLAGLDQESLIKPESIKIIARDGLEVQGLLYLPKTTSESKPPVVFIVHGGPTAQSRPSYRGSIQYLLGRGIAVFQPNVRGSTGFGRTYTTLDDRRNRLESIADLNDMLEFLKKDTRIDANRAAVVGGSYGGYAVNAVLAEYPDAFKAGVSLFGVADWVTALQIASPGLKAADLIEYGDINEPEWLEFYTENSPIKTVDKIKVPVLFSHGVMDPRIDIAETETMVRALRKNGIEAPFIRIPDEGHGWRKLSNQLFYYRREAEFLEKHLGVK